MSEIYIERSPGELIAVQPGSYETEQVLQQLVEDHPDLLAGRQMGANEPRQWLLIAREMGVPVDAEGPDWYSLDHLFIDQDAVPTLVEVKRSSDTRIRREVVGQMLDYAANAASYWNIERLRALAGPVETVLEVDDPDAFWRRAEENLRSGRIRLVFLADDIPTGLQRIIEFLNENLANAEVFGVSVALYEGDGVRAFVPRVVGQTARALSKPGATDDRAYEELLVEATPEFHQCLELLDGWAVERGLDVGTTKVNRKVSLGGVTLVSASPRWDYIQPSLPVLLRASDAEAARAKVAHVLAGYFGARPTADYPMLAAARVAAGWTEFRTQVLEPLVEARRAGESSQSATSLPTMDQDTGCR